MEHVEDFQSWLVDGEDDGSIGLGQLVQHGQEVEGGSGVQSGGGLIEDKDLRWAEGSAEIGVCVCVCVRVCGVCVCVCVCARACVDIVCLSRVPASFC